jgi:hypothetical protein
MTAALQTRVRPRASPPTASASRISATAPGRAERTSFRPRASPARGRPPARAPRAYRTSARARYRPAMEPTRARPPASAVRASSAVRKRRSANRGVAFRLCHTCATRTVCNSAKLLAARCEASGHATCSFGRRSLRFALRDRPSRCFPTPRAGCSRSNDDLAPVEARWRFALGGRCAASGWLWSPPPPLASSPLPWLGFRTAARSTHPLGRRDARRRRSRATFGAPVSGAYAHRDVGCIDARHHVPSHRFRDRAGTRSR